MNYQAKSGASSLKIDWVMFNLLIVGHIFFWRPFCFLSAILVFEKKLWKVNLNYHAKSGSPSLKIEWVMINFVFWRPFFLVAILFFGGHLVFEKMLQNVNINYHRKSGASSMKTEWVMPLSPNWYRFVSQSVTTPGIELFSQLKM